MLLSLCCAQHGQFQKHIGSINYSSSRYPVLLLESRHNPLTKLKYISESQNNVPSLLGPMEIGFCCYNHYTSLSIAIPCNMGSNSVPSRYWSKTLIRPSRHGQRSGIIRTVVQQHLQGIMLAAPSTQHHGSLFI